MFGKRFLVEETYSEVIMPRPDGEIQKAPFQGIGLIGSDNYRNMYVATWTDNMNTHLRTMHGTRDSPGENDTVLEIVHERQ